MLMYLNSNSKNQSPPARGRGLKHELLKPFQDTAVAPRAGAWIETLKWCDELWVVGVAPRAGAWIETSWECMKSRCQNVAPRAGAWIETDKLSEGQKDSTSRPPRGGVD